MAKSFWLLSDLNSRCKNNVFILNFTPLSSLPASQNTPQDLLKFWTGWEVPTPLLKLEVVRVTHPTSSTCQDRLRLPSHYISCPCPSCRSSTTPSAITTYSCPCCHATGAPSASTSCPSHTCFCYQARCCCATTSSIYSSSSGSQNREQGEDEPYEA